MSVYGSLIIDNLEGGYYHPDMKNLLVGGENMLDSGETMFGIDRQRGGNDILTTESGKKFWQIVDANYADKHANTAYYGDKADGKRIAKEVGNQLKALAEKMMLSRLDRYSKLYLYPEVSKIIHNNPILYLQFLYACWNGSGNFETFATALNNAYNQGIKDPEKYWRIVQNKRIAKGGLIKKGATILETIKNKVPKKNGLKWLFIGAGILTFFLIVKSSKKNETE